MTPIFYSQGLRVPAPGVDPEVIGIACQPDDAEEETPFVLYLFEHEDATSCIGTLRRSGAAYRLEIDGEAQVVGRPVRYALATDIARWP